MQQHFDVIIAGAGPAGVACAIALRHSGLKVALFDKDVFPRDKTCGDGLTLDTVNQLGLLDESLLVDFLKLPGILPSNGVKVYAHSGKNVSIPIKQDENKRCMFTVSRYVFDDFLFRYALSQPHITAFTGTTITSFAAKTDGIEVHTSKGSFTAQMLIGADGEGSLIARSCLEGRFSDNDKYMALRAYYKNVKLPEDGNLLHFFFARDILPGGIWVFPEADGTCNVGIGMLMSVMKKRKTNLAQVLQKEMATGLLAPYFAEAEAVSSLKGHIIPIGRSGRPISANRLLLLGDAAGLANPLSGEGIGNAIRSGRVAALHIMECFCKNCFDAAFNKAYDNEIYRRMAKEFKNYRLLESLNARPFLNNYLIGSVAPRFVSVFGNPAYVNKVQSGRFFLLKVLRYMMFKK